MAPYRPEKGILVMCPQSRRQTIGLLINNLTEGYQTAIWQGAMEAALSRDANLVCFVGGILHSTHDYNAQRNVLYELVGSDNVDGVVVATGAVMGREDTPTIMKDFCKKYRVPVVSIAMQLEGIPSILLDNNQYVLDLIDHLISVHRYDRIAFFRKQHGNPEGDHRYHAYEKVMKDKGLFDPNLVVPGEYYDSPAEGIHLLIDERKVAFRAIVGVDDRTAIPVMEALRRRGIQIPDNVAVVGFDDIEDSRYTMPPLTTVRQPLREQGRTAINKVLRILGDGPEEPNVELKAHLIIRESCGCRNQEQLLSRAPASETMTPRKVTEYDVKAVRSKLAAELDRLHLGPSLSEDPGIVERLLVSFFEGITSISCGTFLSQLDDILGEVALAGGDLLAWQDVISLLRLTVFPLLCENRVLTKAENLWHQARVLISKRSQQAQVSNRLRSLQYTTRLNEINHELITTSTEGELMQALIKGLPHLDIAGCCVSTYENSNGPTHRCRCILAYVNNQEELKARGQKFPLQQLVPPDLLPQGKAYSLVVEPLFYHDKHIGIVVFQAGPAEGSVYETLRGQISSALINRSLFQEVGRLSENIGAIFKDVVATHHAVASMVAKPENKGEGTTMQVVRQAFDRIKKHNANWKWISLRIPNERRTHLRYFLTEGPETDEKQPEAVTFPLRRGSSLGADCFLTGESIRCPDITKEPRYAHDRKGAWSCLNLPLVVSGKSIGVLSVDSVVLDDFDDRDKQYLDLLTVQLATAFTFALSIEALRDADRQKQAHLEAMAHQLVAPLSAIRTNCENILQGRMTAERLKKSLVSVAAQSRIAARTAANFGILADLLVGRAADRKMRKSQQNIVRMVIDLARDYQPMAWANEKNIFVYVRGENAELHDPDAVLHSTILVEYDDGTLPQVVGNVLENAVKYSDDFTDIVVNIKDNANCICVEISSKGIRLSSEEVEKIFGHSYRTSEARRKFPPGTGIGLPIARSIMTAHGGKVFALPTNEQGITTFTIELPRSKGLDR